jgi:hypothetical protein
MQPHMLVRVKLVVNGVENSHKLLCYNFDINS